MRARRFLQSLVCLLCLAACLLCFSGCDKYAEKRSSKKDRTVVADVGGYEVRYELYRALFYTYRATVDGGDGSVWTGPDSAVYLARIKEMIEDGWRELYGTFAMAAACGIDPFSDGVDDLVNEYVRVEIEGGYFNGAEVEGHGSQKAYLQYLEDNHFTDSAYRLFLRRQACLKLLSEYYHTTFADGTVAQDEATVRAFYEGDECLNFLWVKREKSDVFDQAAWMAEALSVLQGCTTYEQRREQMVLYGYNLSPDDINYGILTTAASADAVYREVIEAVQTLNVGELSGIIETYEGYYIVMKTQKDPTLPDDPGMLTALSELYIDHCLFTRLEETANGLSVSYKSAFDAYKNGPDD